MCTFCVPYKQNWKTSIQKQKELESKRNMKIFIYEANKILQNIQQI